jgi:hypothetical protein
VHRMHQNRDRGHNRGTRAGSWGTGLVATLAAPTSGIESDIGSRPAVQIERKGERRPRFCSAKVRGFHQELVSRSSADHDERMPRAIRAGRPARVLGHPPERYARCDRGRLTVLKRPTCGSHRHAATGTRSRRWARPRHCPAGRKPSVR